jgi:phosphate transport system protein
MSEKTGGHIMQRYNEEMSRLHELVLQIADLVRSQLRNAVQTLQDKDIDSAPAIIERDKEVNDLDVLADDEVVNLIARRQPLANDLREILTVAKIVTDLERVGDEARKIARLTIQFYGVNTPAPNKHIVKDIVTMARFVDHMLDLAIRSYDELDLQLALEVLELDLEIESEFGSALRRLSTFLMEDARSVGHVVETVLGLRALERIGGHAKNIAGYVVFLVKGKDVRHEDLQAVAAEIASEK